jgi:hypothetical protein
MQALRRAHKWSLERIMLADSAGGGRNVLFWRSRKGPLEKAGKKGGD